MKTIRAAGRACLAVAAVLAGCVGFAATSAAAQSVAYVTDVVGRVVGPAPIAIDSDLPAGARVQIAAGATLEVIYYGAGEQFTFRGPADIEFRVPGPQVISGVEPLRKASPTAKGGKIVFQPGLRQGGYQLRRVSHLNARIRLLNLSRTTTLDASPEFLWKADPNTKYRFELADETGRSLHETEVTGGSFTLPDSMRLAEGIGYTWQVSARLADGGRYSGGSDFRIATADLQGRARELRPREGAPVSERVIYAKWLEQEQLWDEARKYWRAIAVERPEHAQLKALAGE